MNEERSPIRIHLSEVRIRGSGSAPKCHGFPTLVGVKAFKGHVRGFLIMVLFQCLSIQLNEIAITYWPLLITGPRQYKKKTEKKSIPWHCEWSRRPGFGICRPPCSPCTPVGPLHTPHTWTGLTVQCTVHPTVYSVLCTYISEYRNELIGKHHELIQHFH